MKRLILTLSAIAIFCFSSLAQDHPGADMAKKWQERIESEKIAFLTAEMELTPQEAQVFWPVYNQAQKEQREAVGASLKAYGELDNAVRSGKTGKEVETLLKAYSKALEDRDSASSKYLEKYLKILSAEKVAKLYVGEEKFRQSQINRLRQPGNAPAQQQWPRTRKDNQKQ